MSRKRFFDISAKIEKADFFFQPKNTKNKNENAGLLLTCVASLQTKEERFIVYSF